MKIEDLKPEDKYGYDVFVGRDGASRFPKKNSDQIFNGEEWESVCDCSKCLQGFLTDEIYRRAINLGNDPGVVAKWRLVGWNEPLQRDDEMFLGSNWWLAGNWVNCGYVSKLISFDDSVRAVRRPNNVAMPEAAQDAVESLEAKQCESKSDFSKDGFGIRQCKGYLGHQWPHFDGGCCWSDEGAIPVSGEWILRSAEPPQDTNRYYDAQFSDGTVQQVCGNVIVSSDAVVRWFKPVSAPPPPPVQTPEIW